MGSGPPLPFSAVVGEGRRWLADGLLNLLLFVPLGLGLGWNGRSVLRAATIGFLLSTAIELAQLWIPGRDSSLSDVIFNTAGTIVGALLAQRPRAWIVPDLRQSGKLLAAALGIMIAVMLLTAWLLSPTGDARLLTRTDAGTVLSFPTRADDVGLDAPVYWLSPSHADTVGGVVPVRRDRAHWLVTDGSRVIGEAGPTVGEGWALLGYPDAIAPRWAMAISALWVALLCALIGYWARGLTLASIAAVAIALILLVLPLMLGMVRTPFSEWIAATLGFFAGAGLRLVAQRIANRVVTPAR